LGPTVQPDASRIKANVPIRNLPIEILSVIFNSFPRE
jgi:hypothetical protein